MVAETSQPLGQALALLRQGRRLDGETLLLREIETAESQRSFFGRSRGSAKVNRTTPASPAHAAALFDLGQYWVACEDPERAIPALRLASALTPTDSRSRRDRLTYEMNLGSVLELAGQLDEAEAVLRTNVDERRSFYGDGSEGLAWGLEPLAAVLLAQGHLEDAGHLAGQALDILWQAGSPRIASVLALVGAIRSAQGAEPPLVPRFDALAAELKLQTLEVAVHRARIVRDVPELNVADELVARCSSIAGGETRVRAARAGLFHVARSMGAHVIAASVARAVAEAQDASGDARGAALGFDALAQELVALERQSEAEAAFAEGERRSRALGDRLVLAHTLRNCGLMLAEQGQPGWREKLEAALASAESAGAPANGEELARAAGALGVQLQHAGELERAIALLARAATIGEQALPPADSDLYAIRAHLEAVRAGKTCGCGPARTVEQRHALEAAITALVQQSLPSGLVDWLEIGADGDWHVHAVRELESEDEGILIYRALEHALAQVRAGTRD